MEYFKFTIMATSIKRVLIKIWKNSAIQNNQTLASYVEPSEGIKVLDIGVDEGSMILERLNGKVTNSVIYGVDTEKQKIIKAKKKGIIASYADCQVRLPYKNRFFDLVSANQIIEHVNDLDTFMSEAKRVLKPNGYLIISTENLSSWHNLIALFMGWQAFSQHISWRKNIGNPLRINSDRKNVRTRSGMHVKVLAPRGLKDLLNIYGFKIEKFYGAGYYPFPTPISNWLSAIDPSHSVFMGAKARKSK